MRRLSWTVLISLSIVMPARAATIEALQAGVSNYGLVTISGPIEEADVDAFSTRVTAYSAGIVILHSDGGDVGAAIAIGNQIRAKGFSTLVASGDRCTSACAIIWLGGKTRIMGASAQIGFHAAYLFKNGHAAEAGAANALVGAYLSKLVVHHSDFESLAGSG